MSNDIHSKIVSPYVWAGKRPILDTSWHWFQSLFDLSILRYFAIWFAFVPFAAKILSDLPPEFSIKGTSPPITVVISLPFTWQLLWISSILFLGAFLVYQFGAPYFILRYRSFGYYKARQHSPRWIVNEARNLYDANFQRQKFIERLILKERLSRTYTVESPRVIVRKDTTAFIFVYEGRGYELAMPLLDAKGDEDPIRTEIAVRDLFWEILGRYARSRPRLRAVVAGLLALSAACAAIVVSEEVVTGFSYFL